MTLKPIIRIWVTKDLGEVYSDDQYAEMEGDEPYGLIPFVAESPVSTQLTAKSKSQEQRFDHQSPGWRSGSVGDKPK